MRSISHWTPQYIGSRIAEMAYQHSRPDEPWLTRNANLALASLLRPSDIGLEFGSGRSTIWFAKRVKHLTSVEHNCDWHAKITAMIKDRRVTNITYVFREAGIDEDAGSDNPYVSVVHDFTDDSLDFVLIDGALRALCAAESIPKLRSGGMLVIDNVNWYLPSNSRSPNSRSSDSGPCSADWDSVNQTLNSWRVLWTTNGVSDTAIFFKP